MTTVGMGGAFTDPKQFGWTLTTNPDPSLGRQVEAQKNFPQVGTSQNVLLATPEEMTSKIPLFVKAGHIGFQQAAANHPILDASFLQMREVSGWDNAMDKTITEEYNNLLQGLSSNLKSRLEADLQKPIEERDPNLHALDLTLQFAAGVMSSIARFSRSIPDKDPALEGAQMYQSLPNAANQASLSFASTVLDALEQYALSLGPNHPSYDMFMQVVDETKRQIEFLKKDI